MTRKQAGEWALSCLFLGLAGPIFGYVFMDQSDGGIGDVFGLALVAAGSVVLSVALVAYGVMLGVAMSQPGDAEKRPRSVKSEGATRG